MRKIVFSILLIVCIFCTTKTISASENAIVINTSTIKDENVKKTFDNFEIKIENEEYCLYCKNIRLASSVVSFNTINFDFSYNGYHYVICCNLETKNVKITYEQLYSALKNCYIQLSTIEGVHTIKVFPEITSNECYVLEGIVENENIIFNDLEFTYQNDDHNYKVNLSFCLDKEKHILTIIENGITHELDIKKSQQTQKVFVEKLIHAHICESDYLPRDIATNLFDATQFNYNDEQINKAVSSEKITLVSTKTGLQKDSVIIQYISYMKRIGYEEYDEGYDFQIQVAGRYEDDICYEFHNSEKTYSIFGEAYYVTQPKKTITIETFYDYDNLQTSDWMNEQDFQASSNEKLNVKEKTMYTYKNYTQWSNYAYSSKKILANELTDVTTQYNYRIGNYSLVSPYTTDKEQLVKCQNTSYCQWDIRTVTYKSTIKWLEFSDYIYDNYKACDINTNCKYRSKIMYAQSVALWGELSPYIYSDSSIEYKTCKNNEDCVLLKKEKYYKAVGSLSGKYSSWQTSCSNDSDYRCQTYYKYTCDTFIIPTTVYSANSYSIDTNGVCPSNSKITKKEQGYRKAYLTFKTILDSEYTLDSCSQQNGYTKCFQKNFYAIKKRTWSSYSDYVYTSNNASDDNVRYKSKIMYSYQYYDWSDYELDLDGCEEDEYTKCRVQEEYSVNYITWSKYSGWVSYLPKEKYIEYQTRYKYRTREYLGLEMADKVPDGMILVSDEIYYQFDFPTEIKILKEMYKIEEVSLGDCNHLSNSEILDLSDSVARNSVMAQYILSKGGIISKEEYEDAVNKHRNDDLFISEKYRFLNSNLFLPDIYIKTHYRGKKVQFVVDTYSANKLLNITTEKSASYQIQTAFEVRETTSNTLRVEFYNPLNPMDKYRNIPLNWLDQERLIEKIKLSMNLVPLKKYKFTLADMKNTQGN